MHFVRSSIPLCSALLLAAAGACSSDDPATPPSPAADAGTEAADDAAQDAPVSQEASDDASGETSLPDAQAPAFALFVGSDFATTSQLVALDLSNGKVAGRLESDDQDTLAGASGGRGFLLHRTQGKVTLLEPASPWVANKLLDVSAGADAAPANPYAVVVSAGNAGYVLRYGANQVPIVDLASGQALASVDLTELADTLDGLVDAFAGAYDAAAQRVYIGLQRIDQNEFGAAPDYVGACHAMPAAIVGIDAATRTVVDLNGAADGKVLELKAVNPSELLWDEASRTLLVMGVGCAATDSDGGSTRQGRGVERVNVDDATTSWAWQSTGMDRPAALLRISANMAVVGLDDAAYTRHWWLWNPADPALGAELQGVPLVPTHDGAGALVGLRASGQSYEVVRYDLAAQTASVLAAEAFSLPSLTPYSSASLR
jgi:hypothetical protein